ncbi:MAG: hypothetical protein OHM56_04795 [Spiroplasma phoeniceum]|nr:MAG: hypothetical protein OHM57_04195 [Spiroplasma phoeniceum]UZQ33256.1 MAG: hypothetical protein OHM56_04795 [Spiroplasma phoeniceum]
MKNITNWEKNKTNKLKYIIAIEPAGSGQNGIIIYNRLLAIPGFIIKILL